MVDGVHPDAAFAEEVDNVVALFSILTISHGIDFEILIDLRRQTPLP
jgi:hypothetical protein